MLNGIQNSTSVSATYATSYVAPTQEETTESSQSTGVAANYDTYTVSDEAKAAMAMSAEASEDTAVGDVTTESGTNADVAVGDTDIQVDDADGEVEVEDTDEVEEEEVEEEPEAEVEGEDSSSYGNGYISSAEARMTLMSNQMNTLTSMFSALNGESTNIASEDWFSDAMTNKYAGKYLAKSAAGTHNVQQNDLTETESEKTEVSYFDYDDVFAKADAEESE